MEALWNGGINAMIAVFSLAGCLSTSTANFRINGVHGDEDDRKRVLP